MTTLANLKSDNSVISKFDYTYDKAGNRTGVTEADGSRVTYLYDATYQLTGEHRTGTTPYRNTFTYDSRGNRTLKNESGGRTTYSYDAANQLVYAQAPTGRTTYTFDNNGNQTGVLAPNGDRTTTTWDYENRTTGVQLPTGTRNTMAYEPDGLRIKLEDSTGTKKFIWDQQNYLAETDGNNDTQVVYTNEPQTYGNLISQRRSGATSYYHSEALGSTRQLTNASEVVTDTYLYDAWGNVLTSSGSTVNPFQWTGNVGYYFDEDTGNFYIRARTYQCDLARWSSEDPIELTSEINYFTYCFNRPISRIDPAGLAPAPCVGSWCCAGVFPGAKTGKQVWDKYCRFWSWSAGNCCTSTQVNIAKECCKSKGESLNKCHWSKRGILCGSFVFSCSAKTCTCKCPVYGPPPAGCPTVPVHCTEFLLGVGAQGAELRLG